MNPQLLLLNGFFVCGTIFIGLMFLDAALTPFYRLLAVYAENAVLALALVFLIQFAFHFPNRYSQHKWEARLGLAVSVAYLMWEIYFMIYRYYSLLIQGRVYYRSHFFAYAMVGVLLIAPIAFVRQSISADLRNVNWLRKLWKPEGKDARGALSFVLVFGIMFVLGIFNILLNYDLPYTIYNAAMSIGLLIVLWLFSTNYINFMPGGVSVQVKLSILSLTLFLALLGSVGWFIAPPYIDTFQSTVLDHQTLRFTPNSAGGYDVEETAFSFESELGERIQVSNSDMGSEFMVNFVFPFYGRTYSEIFIDNSGAVGIGAPFWQPDMQAKSLNIPAIFPLLIDLDANPSSGIGGGLFLRHDSESGRLIITWDRLPAIYTPEEIFTFQVVLNQDGVFDITYNGLPLPFVFDPDATPSANPWVRGVVSGQGEPLHTNADDLLTTASQGGSPLIENFHLGFRVYLHEFMRPLAGILIGGSLALLIVLPLLTRFSVIKPLNALSAGVREMHSGNLMIEIPVQNEDEIGFLTNSFNVMAARLGELVRSLEARFQEFFEYEPDYCFMVSPEGAILDANPAALNILGYEKNELLGKPLSMIYAPESKEKIEQLLKKWEDIESLTNEEIIIAAKSGETRTVLLSAWAVRDRDGNLMHSLSIQRDITEGRKAQAQILEQQRLLAAMDERTNLHRELHDGLGQVLSYINVQVEAVQSLLEKEQIPAAKTNLVQLAHAS
ncbi:MAG: PAS domain S-box protein, partial [Chloroflexi bacterium]|nr:PAS domain S-box protein [Chloroflexota bacterium]